MRQKPNQGTSCATPPVLFLRKRDELLQAWAPAARTSEDGEGLGRAEQGAHRVFLARVLSFLKELMVTGLSVHWHRSPAPFRRCEAAGTACLL